MRLCRGVCVAGQEDSLRDFGKRFLELKQVQRFSPVLHSPTPNLWWHLFGCMNPEDKKQTPPHTPSHFSFHRGWGLDGTAVLGFPAEAWGDRGPARAWAAHWPCKSPLQLSFMEKVGELGREKFENILILLVLEYFLMLSACSWIIYVFLGAMSDLLLGQECGRRKSQPSESW